MIWQSQLRRRRRSRRPRRPQSALPPSWKVLSEVKTLRGEFPDSANLLYTMGLYLGIGDYDDLFRDNVLDGPGDKKIDFFRIDRETGCAIIAQDFDSPKGPDVDPPANKAADLNTAVNWLLDSKLDSIPRESVRAAAEELREALANSEVHTIQLYYVHNGRETKDVDAELATVQASVDKKLDQVAKQTGAPVTSLVGQFGFPTLVGLYEARHSSIRVTDDIELDAVTAPQTLAGPQWKAASATLKATDLVGLVKKHGEAIYSANIRDYLGVRAYARNINQQIAKTAVENPENF